MVTGELVEGVKYFVRDIGQVKPGEEVLVLTDTWVDPDVYEAYAVAARSLGGLPNIIIVPYTETFGDVHEPLSKTARHAMYGADVVFQVISDVYHPSIRSFCVAACEYGTRIVQCDFKRENLEGEYTKFPIELLRAIIKNQGEKLKKAKKLHITCSKGSKFVCDLIGTPTMWSSSTLGGGNMGTLGSVMTPPAICAPRRRQGTVPGAQGVLYMDELEGFPRGLTQPSKWTIEYDGNFSWVTSIEGGLESKAFWKKWKVIENANLFAEAMWGIHPKVGLRTNPLFESGKHDAGADISRGSGVIHFAMGSPPSRSEARGDVSSLVHVHGHMYKPTIYADDMPIIIEGHALALDDPEIRSLASKYGNPDDILREKP